MGRRGVAGGICLAAVCAAMISVPASASAETFSNPTALLIPSFEGTAGALLPYPSAIGVSGMQGTVTKVTARLTGVAYDDVDELAALLVAPDGNKVILMNSPCENTGTVGSPRTWTFDDAAAVPLPSTPPCPSGTYRPSDSDAPFYLVLHPAPEPPYSTSLPSLNGAQPNGVWELFVTDDALSAGGSIAGGWSLDLTTTGAPPATPPATPVKKKKCKKRKHRAAAEAKKRCKKKGR